MVAKSLVLALLASPAAALAPAPKKPTLKVQAKAAAVRGGLNVPAAPGVPGAPDDHGQSLLQIGGKVVKAGGAGKSTQMWTSSGRNIGAGPGKPVPGGGPKGSVSRVVQGNR